MFELVESILMGIYLAGHRVGEEPEFPRVRSWVAGQRIAKREGVRTVDQGLEDVVHFAGHTRIGHTPER